jgi:hypothetical protein
MGFMGASGRIETIAENDEQMTFREDSSTTLRFRAP